VQSYPTAPGRVLYLVVSAAPPARQIGELVELAQQVGWTVVVIATPRAATWIDLPTLSEQTGYPVRSEYKQPDDPDVLPRADAIAVVPATFNTINKWAAGISDTFALGILNEALGLNLPIVVEPYAKPVLTSHPAFDRNIALLRSCGVLFLEPQASRPAIEDRPFRWSLILEALPER
jgi:phosphopantothenoylcysteine decarboxylase